MGKIDVLSNEIKKYTKSYGDILVGMHNDITKYKNDVKTQSSNTSNALQKIEYNLIQVNQLRVDAEDKLNKINDYFEFLSEAEKNVRSEILEFKTEKQTLYENLSSVKEDLSIKIDLKSKELNKQIEILSNNLLSTKKELYKEFDSKNKKINKELNLIKKSINNKQNVVICVTILVFAAIAYLYYKML